MKARVKATGEIVDIIRNSAFDKDVLYDSNGQKYNREELSFDFKEKSFPKDTPDYWTRLEHQYAGMAMQGMIRRAYEVYCDDCANYENMIFEDAHALLKDHAEALADVCVEYSHALVQKLKEKEEK